MDLIEGPHFDTWANDLARDHDGQRAFLRAAYLIARALEAAHTCHYHDDAGFEITGVLHGDIKPGNIVMRVDGTPALMDFMLVDIHRAIDPETREQFDTTGTATAVFGTPGFMAPEQMNEGIVTVRTDVFGLGATLRAAAGDLALPTEIGALIGRMTGEIQARPGDMNEVARAIAGIARGHGMESAEMTRDLLFERAPD
jgi:serine/threonine protein kinase